MVCGVMTIRETRCEAVRLAGCVYLMMLMRMRMRGRGWWLCVDVSLSGNGLRAEGGTAIAGALPRLSSLTTLKYVHIEGDVWCVSYTMEPCRGRC